MLNVLIAECEELEFGYEVIGVVENEAEALDLMREDMAARERKLESGDDPGICPYIYKMYQRGFDGHACVFSRFATEIYR